MEWHWDKCHVTVCDLLKSAITDAPCLRYFDIHKPVTLSVGASSKGLGAIIFQDQCPVAYASRAINQCEQNYSKIEKKMLAITFGCAGFHDYCMGKKRFMWSQTTILLTLSSRNPFAWHSHNYSACYSEYINTHWMLGTSLAIHSRCTV